MAKLIISRDARVLQEVELGAGRMTIGRHPHNDIVIADAAVSGRHAAITGHGAGATLEDLGSSNGTFVNSARITQAALADRDLIRIARFQIEFVAGTAPPQGSIEVLNGASAGKRISLHKALTTLGSPGLLVVVISRGADAYYMAQVQGEAVARLNDQPVDRTPRLLRDGDLLELTGTQMRFSATFC